MSKFANLIARNLTSVKVGDVLTIVNGEVFKEGQKVSSDLTSKIASDGEYLVKMKSGAAPGVVGYYC